MTKEEILAMEAGRKLSRLVAEKVMGLIAWEEKRGGYSHIIFQKPEDREPYRRSKYWEKEMERYRIIDYSEINDHTHVIGALPEYSTDISAAWEVAEKFQTYQVTKTHQVSLPSGPEDMYRAIVNANKFVAYAKTAPLAICRAALLAVMEDN